MRTLIFIGGAVVAFFILSRMLRSRRAGPVRRARKEMQRAVSDVEGTLEDLAARAKKLRGEAKETVEVQIRALRDRREQLMDRISAMTVETRKLTKKAREAATRTPATSEAK